MIKENLEHFALNEAKPCIDVTLSLNLILLNKYGSNQFVNCIFWRELFEFLII